jgi:hypothetical protein
MNQGKFLGYIRVTEVETGIKQGDIGNSVDMK